MKNNLPCEIVRDLLPGYVDALSSETTNIAVEKHLEECADCKRMMNNMKSEGSKQMGRANSDKKLFKKIKTKMNRRTKAIIAASALAVSAAMVSSYVLFNVPLKNIALLDVKVSANVYPVSSLEKNEISFGGSGVLIDSSNNEVKISSGENDNSSVFQITVPSVDNDAILVTEDILKKVNYVTTVSWSSPYFLRKIEYDSKRNEKNGDIIYVSAFKTTLLGNKAQEYNAKMMHMEFKQINKIIFVDSNGKETTLWENTAQ